MTARFIEDYLEGIGEVSRRQSALENRNRDYQSNAPRSNDGLAELRQRYNDAYVSLGARGAPQPLPSESEYSFRRRLASGIQHCSATWRDADFHVLPGDALSAIEPALLQDTQNYVDDRTRGEANGKLRRIESTSDGGHKTTSWAGPSALSWMVQFMGPRFALRSIKGPDGKPINIQRATITVT